MLRGNSSYRRLTPLLLAFTWALCCVAFAPAVASAEGTGSIGGTVTEAGGAEAPLLGAEVCAFELNGGESRGCELTNDEGEYVIANLPEGEYEVYFSGEACISNVCSLTWAALYYNDTTPGNGPTPVDVTEGLPTEGIDASLEALGQIEGMIESAAGGPAANMLVCVDATTRYYNGCMLTNGNGEYTVPDLPPSEYVVEFSGETCEAGASECTREACETASVACTRPYTTQFYPDAPEYGSPGVQLVPVNPRETTEGVDATVSPGGKIEGTVTTAALGKAGIGGIKVCAAPETGEILVECATTQANGQYTIEGLASESFQVEFSSEICAESCSVSYVRQFFAGTASPSEETPVSITAPATRTDVNATLLEIAPKQPASLTSPVLSGSPSVGTTLSCSEGTWSNGPTVISYWWLRNGVAIAGQSASSYTVSGADEGATLTCEVVVANTAGLASATSNALNVPAEKASLPQEGAPQQPGFVTGPAPPAEEAKAGLAVAAAKAGAAGSLPKDVSLTLTCEGEGPCKGSLRLVYTAKAKHGKAKAKKVVIGTASFAIGAGSSEAIAVKLTGRGAGYVAKSGRHGLKVKLAGSGVKPRALLVKLVGKESQA